MAAVPNNATKITEDGVQIKEESQLGANEIDRNAPAGSENSLGAQSVRDGRPSTDDAIVEAMDEVTPDLDHPLVTDKKPE